MSDIAVLLIAFYVKKITYKRIPQNFKVFIFLKKIKHINCIL